jgi:hypothetical protein
MKILYTGISLMLTACIAPPVHPPVGGINTSRSDYGHDRMQCKMLANQYLQNNDLGTNMFSSFVIENEINKCMLDLGYR